jgi:hypothetical protein
VSSNETAIHVNLASTRTNQDVRLSFQAKAVRGNYGYPDYILNNQQLDETFKQVSNINSVRRLCKSIKIWCILLTWFS